MSAMADGASRRIISRRDAPSNPSLLAAPNSSTFATSGKRLRILVATDAWRPQVNGVVRTHEWLAAEAPKLGAEIVFLTPDQFRTVAMPTYPEIRLALSTKRDVARTIDSLAPDAIHIATEGPIGYATRRYCLARRRRFTTCYHTRFPEYLAARFRIPVSLAYWFLRRFHNAASATMVATGALEQELRGWGFSKTIQWRRGINARTFADAQPRPLDLPRPIFLTVGRVAVEKNIEAFLRLDLPGSKVVVGDGPERARLAAAFPDCHFLGTRHGSDLAAIYASADAFVFPSLTDTFGLVMLEALSAGTPVAAFPVTGPREVIGNSGCGVMNEDLRTAALAALQIPRDTCRAFGARHSMEDSARSFLDNIRRAVLGVDQPQAINVKAA